jgi:hypothetical protein|tara:strand:+ start:88 stop:1353 length:1266 start_codon:yes stop_codon:yes gene_type:complete
MKHTKKNVKEGNDNSELDLSQNTYSNNIIVWLVFITGFTIILFSMISVIFPGLLISLIGDSEFLEPFEMSMMGIPVIVVNVIVISLIILHKKQILPNSILSYIKKIFSFDLSQKQSLIFLIIILGIYVGISANEIKVYELNQYGDFLIVERAIEIWPDQNSENKYVTEQLSRHVRMALLVASEEIFDNVKIIPYLASILLLVTSYFLTIKFSKKNFTGLIAVILILQSSTFFTYDTIAVYENFWVLFYVFSIYLIFQKPKISSIFYILSVFSKAITLLMLPISILVTVFSDISNKKKIFVIVTHVIVLILSLIVFQISDTIYGNIININTSEFLTGFSTLAFNLRFDVFLLLFLLPVSIGLFLKARDGSKNAISLMILICGTILVTPVLEMLTDFYFVYPYRYVPLVTFFAIAFSSIFSKK